jgi:hypothetical protein
MKIGIAISVYDKAAEVATNVSIIRNHWKHKDVFISVCCNHPQTYEKLKSLDIDSLCMGEDYQVIGKSDLRLRQYDCIKKSLTEASKNSEYTFHWHADAYCLDSDSLISLIQQMKSNDYLISARGVWKNYKAFRGESKAPYGEVDDHFFCIRSDHLVSSKMYNDNEQVQRIRLLGQSIASEGILALLMQESTTEDRILIYSDMRECEVSPDIVNDSRFFYEDNIPHRTLCPYNLDRGRKFLHSEDFKYTRRFFNELDVSTDLICENL